MRLVVALGVLLLLGSVSGCRYGAPPGLPYAEGPVHVVPDGNRSRLVDDRTYRRDGGITGVAPYRGGHLVADGRTFEGTVGLASVVDGRRTALGPCATGVGALSPDRRLVAWVTTGCPEADLRAESVVHIDPTGTGGGGWTRNLGPSYLFYAVGFLGDDVVLTGLAGPVVVVPESGPVRTLPRLRHAVDVHGSLVAGRHGVLDATTGLVLWSDPRAEVTSFSPDGRLVVTDGALRAARTGALVASLPRGLTQVAWEDARHLVAVAARGRWSALLRIGLDGRGALLAAPVRRSPAWWVLEAQP
ncbi:hypothetical protein G5V58_02610 [Nocardioides anomalus]|uniref:Uncharacterized protein n=1 Tax=Nocardioides anomalus TaxID=2712223 RepID=A0A6G6W9N5_9ACTN|nr:hypothetical protein [Nocardioides anomalus]QIG41815.1 hypothetical protein G5V58_02610 [Nocardioides anomalus]